MRHGEAVTARQRFLDRNESETGTSPAVIRALRSLPARHLSHYLDGYHRSILTPVLSRRFGVPEERIFLSYGLEDFLRSFFGGLRRGRDVVLTNELHYAYYDQVAKLKGIRIATFKLRRGRELFSFDVDDCIRQLRRVRPAALVLTTPNNPTGHVITPAELREILAAAPRRTLVLLDEAYIGFQHGYDEQAFLRLLRRHPNLALLRTFSKDYGLAGLRLGYILGGRDVPRMLRDESRELGFSRVHEAIGLAALRDEAHHRRVVERVRRLRDRFTDAVNELRRFRAYRSEANFVLVECRSTAAYRRLLARQRRTRVVITKSYGRRYVRVSIGRPADVRALLRTMSRIEAAIR